MSRLDTLAEEFDEKAALADDDFEAALWRVAAAKARVQATGARLVGSYWLCAATTVVFIAAAVNLVVTL